MVENAGAAPMQSTAQVPAHEPAVAQEAVHESSQVLVGSAAGSTAGRVAGSTAETTGVLASESIGELPDELAHQPLGELAGEPAVGFAQESAEELDPEWLDERDDWAWVEEWRAGREPVPWSMGVTLSVFVSLVVCSAIYVLNSGLADKPLIAVLVNLVVAGGLAPAIWLSRGLPVLRWIAFGAALGVVAGWIGALAFLF